MGKNINCLVSLGINSYPPFFLLLQIRYGHKTLKKNNIHHKNSC
eukprot:UN05878